jgi:ArsR family transcriptional regulator, cadmium/lead-responsive transcriptional repressor
MTVYEDISFVVRAKNRKAVFRYLIIPKTPTHISKELKINIGFVSNILIELKKRELIECLTPNEKRHRLYRITKKGEKILKQLKNYEE